MRSAFSPVISEALDRSDGIYHRSTGELIAQGELGLPVFVGTMQFTVQAVIERVRERGVAVEPGDVFIVNDPYLGGTHLMDVKFVKPFFHQGRLWCWLANTGHWPDTGGMVPGGFSANATEVEQEGLRLPPVKLFKEGVMDDPKVDVIFGLHIEADIEVGHIQYKPGAFMASSDWFHIVVKGKGSHGSQPWLGVDPVVVSAQIIEGLQTIVSRQSVITHAPVVITVGKIQAGVRSNIIPAECVMDGTIRCLDSKMQLDVHERIKRTATHIAEAGGATAEVTIDSKTLVTYNTPELVRKMVPSLQAAAGTANVTEREWVTGAEDFSYFGTKAPAFFFYLGGMPRGNDPKLAPPHHTAEFYVDDEGMKTGIKAFCQLVVDYMNMK